MFLVLSIPHGDLEVNTAVLLNRQSCVILYHIIWYFSKSGNQETEFTNPFSRSFTLKECVASPKNFCTGGYRTPLLMQFYRKQNCELMYVGLAGTRPAKQALV